MLDVIRFSDRITGVLYPEEMERLQPMIRQVLVNVLEDKAWVDDLMAFRRLKAIRPTA